MRVKEFFIKRYGPLREKGHAVQHDFILFFGKNEDGKTLTIDALVRLLLGKNVKDFNRIDRVEEKPEGYVILMDDEGREVKVPEKGTLEEVAELTPSECRNIFFIRNSDLSISHETEFYTRLMDRLVGVRVGEISRIKEALREIGRMTPSGSFRDVKDEKLKTRMDRAENLIQQIGDFAEEIRKQEYEKLEEEYEDSRQGLDGLRGMVEGLEHARRRELYEKGTAALGELRKSLEDLSQLEAYTEKDEQVWRDCQRDVRRLEHEKKGLEVEVEREETELKKVGKDLGERETEFRVLEEMKNRVDHEFRQDLTDYERRCETFAKRQEKNRLFILAGIVSTVLLFVCLLGIILRPSLLFSVLAILFSLAAAALWIVNFQVLTTRARLAGIFERIRLGLSRFDMGAETIEGILSNIQRFDVTFRQRSDEIDSIRRRRETMEARIREWRERGIPDIAKKISEAEARIDEIKVRSHERSLEKHAEKLRTKQGLERLIGEQESILRSLFGQAQEALDQNISFWEKEIRVFEEYGEKAKNVKYSEDAVSRMEKQRQALEDRLKEISDKMVWFEKRALEIEREVNEVLRSEEGYLYCRTSIDVEVLTNKLRVFLEENERNRQNVLEALAILEEMEMEEKEKVTELFGAQSPVSEYFNGVTGGLYEDVAFDRLMGQVEVRRKDGTILSGEKLSGGAYDQLYFCVRLALGERLLKGKKGFFVLDDPFVKADSDRLRRQVGMLKKISQMGWQILYFSAKEEIKNVFQEDVERGVIQSVPIEGIFS